MERDPITYLYYIPIYRVELKSKSSYFLKTYKGEQQPITQYAVQFLVLPLRDQFTIFSLASLSPPLNRNRHKLADACEQGRSIPDLLH